MTRPTSGPGVASASGASETVSGRTRAIADPSGESAWTSGSRAPRTSTSPPFTTPAIRLVSPTNSATKEVAGRE